MRAETVPMVKQFLVYSASSRSRMASSRSLVRFSNAALSANNITQIEAVLSVQYSASFELTMAQPLLQAMGESGGSGKRREREDYL